MCNKYTRTGEKNRSRHKLTNGSIIAECEIGKHTQIVEMRAV